jgi:hypothetical protein
MTNFRDIFPWLRNGSIFQIDGQFFMSQRSMVGNRYLLHRLKPSAALYFIGALRNGNRDHGSQYDRKNQTG